jgi:hypothetical protein
MISLKEVVEKLKIEPVSSINAMDRPIVGGYASDLLSCAMKGAKKGYLWVTLQSHLNVVAVASLAGLAGVIITEGNRPDAETLSKAESEGVVLLVTPRTTFSIVGELASLGVRGD